MSLTMVILEKEKEVRDFFSDVIKKYNVTGVILVDKEGLPLISEIPKNMDEDIIASSIAAVSSGAEIAVADLEMEPLKLISIETDKGILIIEGISTELILGVIATTNAKLAIIRRITKEIAEFLEKLSKKSKRK